MKQRERGNLVEMHSSKKRFPVLEIAKINLRHNALLSIVVAVLLCLVTPLFIGTANLDHNSAAMPLEMFVSLIGIVLLTPVFQPEQNEEIDDLVSSKYCSTAKVHLIRTVYSAGMAALLICVFTVSMKLQSCDVTPVLALGTIADALFLGSMGMLTSAVTGNTVIGYMPPLLYYALNIGMGPKLGSFYLFSMATGSYTAKLWLFVAGILMMAAALFYQRLRKRMA